MKNKGILYLIPTYLSDTNGPDFIAPVVKDIILHTDHYLVENVRTARRYIGSLGLGKDISSIQFTEMNKDFQVAQLTHVMAPLAEGKNLGIISEAGLPAVADPGNLAVSFAHKNNIQVVALPGASSIMQALVSSGFNGQNFTFHGYLPIEKNERIAQLKHMEKEVSQSGYTQLFMETPYRNGSLIQSIVENLSQNTFLFIGADLTGTHAFCATQSIAQWKQLMPDIHKVPAIFALGRRN